jgi:post-segregation antitoxin (ccd killing protein)
VADGAKTTVEVDAALLARLREASMPVSAALTDAELLERAARRQLGLEALHEAQTMSALTEEAAMRVAYGELHAMRRERRAGRER